MISHIFCTLGSFKRLEFKPGLNVLIAQKESGASDKQTRNRAGKTSLIEIVNFLTGSDVRKDSIFRSEALVDASFGMKFDLGGEKLLVERSGQQKSKTYAEGASFPQESARLSNSEWVQLLGEKMFRLHEVPEKDGRTPKFRSLLAYFVRRQLSGAFTTPEKQATMQQTGDYQIALLFLFGLDWKIASDWQKVRDREKALSEIKKAAGVGAFGRIVGKASDLRTLVTVGEARLQELKSGVTAFRVLPEYREMEVEVDQLTRAINDLSNANVIDSAAIRDLERALRSRAWPLNAMRMCVASTHRWFGTVGITLSVSWKQPDSV